jgi:hypothetical protein
VILPEGLPKLLKYFEMRDFTEGLPKGCRSLHAAAADQV